MLSLLTRASNNQPISLTNQLATSGEGEVWETNLDGYLAKIYHNPTPERINKLKVMLANPPVDPMLQYNHVSIAWTKELLKDSSGNYVGFLMPEIKNSRDLSTVYHATLRKKKAAGFNWYYLHVTALNTAWIIQAIHDKGYVLGDIKPQNILVNDRALVAVIDTDSFQVRDSQKETIYRCTVGSEGFTPAELLGKDFTTTEQTEIHDRFRLAVLIHYLLFGYHPFSGQWKGAGDSPEQTELIRQGYWYGSQNSLIGASQTTIPLDIVHPEIKRCFLRCFNEGYKQAHLRPTAKDWHKALQVAVKELTACDKIDSHFYSRTYSKCYWCDRAINLGVDIFPGTVKVNITTSSFTSVVSQIKQPSSPPQVPSQYRREPILSSQYLQNTATNITINSSQLYPNTSTFSSQPVRDKKLNELALAVVKSSIFHFEEMSGKILKYHKSHNASKEEAEVIAKYYIETIPIVKTVQTRQDLIKLIAHIESLKNIVTPYQHNEHKYRWSTGLERVIEKLRKINQDVTLSSQHLPNPASKTSNFYSQPVQDKRLEELALAGVKSSISHFEEMSGKVLKYHRDHHASKEEAEIIARYYRETIPIVKNVQTRQDLMKLIAHIESLKNIVTPYQHNEHKYRWSTELERVLDKLRKIK